MLSGVALAKSELPVELVEAHGLARRVHERGGEAELQFLLADQERLLPVWLDGRLQVVRWGNRRGQSKGLPLTAWTKLETVASGYWSTAGAEEVVIPARLALDRGVWFGVREGLRGIVVRDEGGRLVV